jgi:hypothetical protein
MKVYYLLRGFVCLLLFVSFSVNAVLVDQPELTRLDLFTESTQGRDILIDGDIAYIAAGYDGLYVLDVSDPPNSRVIGHLRSYDFGLSGYSLFTVTKDGNAVFCGFRSTFGGAGDGYLRVVDVSNLTTSGLEIGSSQLYFNYGTDTLMGRTTGSFLDNENKRLYLALRLAGLVVVDVSDPDNLSIVGRYASPVPYEFQEVILLKEHNRAYIGAWGKTVLAIDISDPSPENWTQLQLPVAVFDTRNWYLETDGRYLYVPTIDSPSDNTYDEGLLVYDLTPNFADATVPPELIGFTSIPPQFQCESGPGGGQEGQRGSDPGPHQILLTGAYAVLANGCKGIVVFNITDPTNPVYERSYEIPFEFDEPSSTVETTEYPWSLALKGDYLLSVGVSNPDQNTGHDLMVFRVSPDDDNDRLLDALLLLLLTI